MLLSAALAAQQCTRDVLRLQSNSSSKHVHARLLLRTMQAAVHACCMYMRTAALRLRCCCHTALRAAALRTVLRGGGIKCGVMVVCYVPAAGQPRPALQAQQARNRAAAGAAQGRAGAECGAGYSPLRDHHPLGVTIVTWTV